MEVLTTVVSHVPPHVFMGFELSEWVQLIAIVGFIAGIVAWVVRAAIVAPLTTAINNLSSKVDGIGGNADRVHAEHDRRLDEQDVHLARHDEEFKTVFNQLNREDNHNEQ
ncbi:hypothetical protein [Secundilactobacillus muriivasis]